MARDTGHKVTSGVNARVRGKAPPIMPGMSNREAANRSMQAHLRMAHFERRIADGDLTIPGAAPRPAWMSPVDLDAEQRDRLLPSKPPQRSASARDLSSWARDEQERLRAEARARNAQASASSAGAS